MAKKRQSGRLRNIHTRIPEQDYQKIAEICEKLGITLADYFNRIIHTDGYEELQKYARKIKNEPRSCKIEMSDQTKESIDTLAASLNSQSMQIRRIGTNLSNLVSKNASTGANPDIYLIAAMKKELDVVLSDVHKASSRLTDILYDENTISKVEYRGYDIWDSEDIDIDAVWDEDWSDI